VKEESPALKIGFKNIPINQFGVQKPELKAKARTPELPVLRSAGTSATKSSTSVRSWMGLQIKDMEGEEFSAYGVAKDLGGVEIVGGSHLPLQQGDLIQSLNGKSVKNCTDLEKAPVTHPMTAGIIRDQQPTQVIIP
jgi:S1-C subfamily serine protease